MAKSRGRFKLGCFRCLGLLVLMLVAALIVLGVAAFTARPARVEDRVSTRELPVEGGQVHLEIGEAKLTVKPAGAGAPLRVEARYDVNAFALKEEFDPGMETNGGWTYRAVFGRTERSGAFAGLVSLVRRATADIDVFLPKDVPIDFVLKMKKGGAVVRLAGLWLPTAEVNFESGGLDLSVDEPLREPMERLSIRVANGGYLLNRLGNASPRRLDVSYRMGHIDLDLSGRWRQDAEIDIGGGMGGGVVHLPTGVILKGLDRGNTEGPVESELQPPTLTFSLSTGMGKLQLSDIHLRGIQRIGSELVLDTE